MQVTHNNLPEAISLMFQQQEELKSLLCKLINGNEERLYSPEETRKLFHPAISRGTLSNWTKAGYLQSYSIGGKVFYKNSEVLEAAKGLRKFKQPNLQQK